MASQNLSESQSANSSADEVRRRGRTGLVIPWDSIPWWGIIILIVGFIVSYSMLTSTKYLDALSFVLDLPWSKRVLEDEDVEESGKWTLTSRPLEPGTYTLYVEFLDEDEEFVKRSDVYRIKVPADATERETDPLASPSEEPIEVQTTTPSIAGSAEPGSTVVLYDDFSHRPWRIARRIFLSKGVFLTIRVTLIAFAGALVLGLIFGMMRVANRSPDLRVNAGWRLLIGVGVIVLLAVAAPGWRRKVHSMAMIVVAVEALMFLLPAIPYTLSTLYVEVIRGLPMLVIILYMGFAVTPALRDASQEWATGEIDLRGIPAAIIGLAFGYGAYLAEIFRAGIESIPKGQMEAARSLGMNYSQAMRHVILPQAIRVVTPPLGNNFIAMLKDSSLISVIALPELLQRGRLWISRTFRAFEGYNSVAMLYLVMTLILSLLVRVIERRTAIE